MSNSKHYIITSITLGLIGAASAALIGLTNLVTKDQIAINEKNRVLKGINEIYGNSASISKESAISDENIEFEYKYVTDLYEVSNEDDNKIGYAFKTTGSNMYGKISLIVGFLDSTQSFVGTYVVVNEQTYASTLIDNYINPLNEGGEDKLDDVTCGATYGAKLVRDMVNDAKAVANELWGK